MGDLRGIVDRLDHIADLGADALWLSPIHPSPMADFGYDVCDYMAVDPRLGTLADFDTMIASAHERQLRVVMDLVPAHTSILHPWFRDHPDRYIWANGSSRERPPNNWESIFGGPAWTLDDLTGRWYMHSFYPEQPDLNWHNPDVVRAIQEVVRFWRLRGVDGFRLDAIDTLVQDKLLRSDPVARVPFGLPLRHPHGGTDFVYSRNADGTREALSALHSAAGDALLIGEVYLPGCRWGPYLDALDCIFAFELFHADMKPEPIRTAIERILAACDGTDAVAGWVISNHDFPRLPDRVGRADERLAVMLLLSLPGCVFVYQGDEIGLGDGPGAQPPLDRIGRDAHRHPMQWDRSGTGGFTNGSPWLTPVDPATRNVADQRCHADSTLSFYKRMIALRRVLSGPVRFVDAPEDVLAFDRGAHRVVLNFSDRESVLPWQGRPVAVTRRCETEGDVLPARAGVVFVRE
jgi:alpha-glucosidase